MSVYVYLVCVRTRDRSFVYLSFAFVRRFPSGRSLRRRSRGQALPRMRLRARFSGEGRAKLSYIAPTFRVTVYGTARASGLGGILFKRTRVTRGR